MAAKKKKAASKRASSARKPQGIGAATIVYIHGIGNKPPASVLKQQWDAALFEFDLGEKSRMAYWVDRERYPVPPTMCHLAVTTRMGQTRHQEVNSAPWRRARNGIQRVRSRASTTK